MSVSAAPWSSPRSRPESAAPVEVAPRRVERRRWKASAAATRDLFMDSVVLISVLLFLALVVGVGVLALQQSGLNWPN